MLAGLVLLMLSQVLGAATLSILLLSGGGLALGAGALVVLVVQDVRARAFPRRTAAWRLPPG